MSSGLKERGGGGGKITAPKPQNTRPDGLTPRDTSTPRLRSTPISKSSGGKENHQQLQQQQKQHPLYQRSVSRGKSSVPRQRPAFSSTTTLVDPPPPPHPKKPVLVPAAAVRWSTSTLPKGKSQRSPRRPDPVEARRRSSVGGAGVARASKGVPGSICNGKLMPSSRVSNVVRKERAVGGRVPVVRMSLDEDGMVPLGTVSSDVIPKRNVVAKRSDGVGLESKEVVAGGNVCRVVSKDKACFLPNSKSVVDKGLGGQTGRIDLGFDSKNAKEVSENHKENDSILLASDDVHEKSVVGPGVVAKEIPLLADVNFKETAVSGNVTDRITVFENVVGKKPEQRGTKLANGYSSKLHEKLALLEGKVQRIATDIKRTKEMLDSNNPDSSKLILSDIQNKIRGIEKAVGHVIDGTEGEFCQAESHKEDNAQVRGFGRSCIEASLLSGLDDSKNSVKPLNNEELEARFFPHHRLLRNRLTSNATERHEKSHEPIIPRHACDPITEDGPVSPSEENSVALEFLASLNADYSKINSRDRTTHSNIQKIGSENTISAASQCATEGLVSGSCSTDVILTTHEKLDEFDEQENKKTVMPKYESDDSFTGRLVDIGRKAATGGWFVSEGEAVLLTHGDGSCSYYDIANNEMKAQYMPPPGAPSNLWGDCWLIRASGADGCAGRYVVAASAGNGLQSGFCSWDFYRKDIQAIRVDGMPGFSASSSTSSRTVLTPLPSVGVERGSLSTISSSENRQWWYRPCGYLIASASNRQNVVSAYDIRDGDLIMTWGVQNPVVAMENSSPLQWRSRGKMIVAETEAISLWDVNSLNPQPLLSVSCGGKKIFALHVNNTDAELGGGVRQRVSSSEIEGNDGVFCTQDRINVLDFRLPSGVGLKISKDGSTIHSAYSRADSIFLGSKARSIANSGTTSGVQHFSLRKGKVISTYLLPDAKDYSHQSTITQVWGNSNLVMGICGMGLFVFDAVKDGVAFDHENEVDVREIIGSSDLYNPSFDYLGERVLLISRDRPALWRYLS